MEQNRNSSSGVRTKYLNIKFGVEMDRAKIILEQDLMKLKNFGPCRSVKCALCVEGIRQSLQIVSYPQNARCPLRYHCAEGGQSLNRVRWTKSPAKWLYISSQRYRIIRQKQNISIIFTTEGNLFCKYVKLRELAVRTEPKTIPTPVYHFIA